MKKEKNSQSGMISLEAMFIFPIVFFLVITLCYLTFYLCDYVRIQGFVEMIAEEQVICIKDNENLQQKVNYKKRRERGATYLLSNLSDKKNTLISEIKTKVENEKLCGKLEGVKVSLSQRKVEIQLNMAVSTGIPKVQEYLGGSPFQYQIITSIPVHNPTEFTRAYTALKNTIETTKGINEIKKKLNGIKKVKE